jgi:hypothetical protein
MTLWGQSLRDRPVMQWLELSLSYAPVRWTAMACEENVPTGPAEFVARLEDSSMIRLTRGLASSIARVTETNVDWLRDLVSN